MDRSKAVLKPRLRIQRGTVVAFGPGKAELIRLIGSTGSIRAAAAKMKMSYNRAWMLVRDMNRLFRKPLLVSRRGGQTGGGAALTPTGREVLSRYIYMEQSCLTATKADWQALRRLLR